MAPAVQLVLCLVALAAVGTRAKSIDMNLKKQPFDWLRREVTSNLQRRQSSEELDSMNSADVHVGGMGEAEPTCFLTHMRDMEGCLGPVMPFINDVSMGLEGHGPFNTGAARVATFCQQMEGALTCLNNLPPCEGGDVQQSMVRQMTYVCSEAGRRGLISMDGDQCARDVDIGQLTQDCARNNPALQMPEGPISQSLDECSRVEAEVECEWTAMVARCGADTANFLVAGQAYAEGERRCSK